MTVRTFEGDRPAINPTAYIDEQATIIGEVTIEKNANVWPGAVIRGDLGSVVIEEGAAIQDNTVIHADEGCETVIGPFATIAHCAVVHGASIGRETLVGMNAVVLDDVTVDERSIVAAGSVVTEGKTFPSNVLVAGIPAEVRKEIDTNRWFEAGAEYVELASRHMESSETVIDGGHD